MPVTMRVCGAEEVEQAAGGRVDRQCANNKVSMVLVVKQQSRNQQRDSQGGGSKQVMWTN